MRERVDLVLEIFFSIFSDSYKRVRIWDFKKPSKISCLFYY